MITDIPTKEVFLSDWVKKLPQSNSIILQDASTWYDSVLQHERSRFAWHFGRLLGFGGSEVGDLAAWKLGLPGFSTPETIVGEKLMQAPMVSPNHYIRRGLRMEDVIRQTFYEDYDAESLPDIIQAIRDARSSEHPWMRGNPDDVVRLAGRTYLVDYKAKSYATNTSPINYLAQLQQYDYLGWCAQYDKAPDIKRDKPLCFDGYLIIYYDYPEAKSYPIELDFDPQVMTAVHTAGDYAWDVVLGKRQMLFPREAQVDYQNKQQISDLEQEQLGAMERQWMSLKVLADAAYSNACRVKEDIERLVSDTGERRPSLMDARFNGSTVYYKPQVDEEMLVSILASKGISREDFKVTGDALDAEAMAGRLAKMGEAPSYATHYDIDKIVAYCQENNLRLPVQDQPVIQLSRANIHKAAISNLKDEARAVIKREQAVLEEHLAINGTTKNKDLDLRKDRSNGLPKLSNTANRPQLH